MYFICLGLSSACTFHGNNNNFICNERTEEASWMRGETSSSCFQQSSWCFARPLWNFLCRRLSGHDTPHHHSGAHGREPLRYIPRCHCCIFSSHWAPGPATTTYWQRDPHRDLARHNCVHKVGESRKMLVLFFCQQATVLITMHHAFVLQGLYRCH